MLPFGAVAKKFSDAQRLEVWRNNPAKWAEDHGLFMWSKQREVSQSVVEHQKTLVVTGNGVGKSRLSATLVNWWVDTHPVDDTTVVTTATNWKQVRNVLWKEIPRVKAVAGIRGKVNADATWKIDDRQDPVAFGMKPDDKDESGFQGVHDQYVLVIMDEAGGISKEIFTAADAITTNKYARILAIANPNDPSCYMAEVYKREMRLKPEERSWNIIQFGAYDTPNFTGEVVPVEVATRLVQVDWVEARKKEWGEDDPRFVARVLGEFPDVSDDGLFNMGRVMQSMEAYDTSEPDEGMPITIGVDVARYGSDSSVIVSNQGGYIRIHGRYQGLNGPELARKVGELAVEMGLSRFALTLLVSAHQCSTASTTSFRQPFPSSAFTVTRSQVIARSGTTTARPCTTSLPRLSLMEGCIFLTTTSCITRLHRSNMSTVGPRCSLSRKRICVSVALSPLTFLMLLFMHTKTLAQLWQATPRGSTFHQMICWMLMTLQTSCLRMNWLTLLRDRLSL